MATRLYQIFVAAILLAGCRSIPPTMHYAQPSEYTITLLGHHFIGDLIEVRPSIGLESSQICFHCGEAQPRQFKVTKMTSDSVEAYITGSVWFSATNTVPMAITITTPQSVHTFPLMTTVRHTGKTVLYGTRYAPPASGLYNTDR